MELHRTVQWRALQDQPGFIRRVQEIGHAAHGWFSRTAGLHSSFSGCHADLVTEPHVESDTRHTSESSEALDQLARHRAVAGLYVCVGAGGYLNTARAGGGTYAEPVFRRRSSRICILRRLRLEHDLRHVHDDSGITISLCLTLLAIRPMWFALLPGIAVDDVTMCSFCRAPSRH